MDENKIRDERGKFLPGHEMLYKQPTISVEDAPVNPKYPYLDVYGRFKKGFKPVTLQVHEKQQALQQAITPRRMANLIRSMARLATHSNNEHVRLAAFNAVMDRIVGKPSSNVKVQTESRNVNLDLSILPTEELMNLQQIMAKCTPPQIGHNGTS